jgi:hypothetical protein
LTAEEGKGNLLRKLHKLHELAGPRGSFHFTRRPVQTGPDRSLDQLHQLI